MLLLSLLCGLASMCAFGGTNALSKPLVQRLGSSRTVFLRGLSVCALLTVTAIPSRHRLDHHWIVAVLTVGLGTCGYIPVRAFSAAIRRNRLGVIAPIAATSPLVTVLLSFALLNVPIAGCEWAAIVTVIAANIASCVDLSNWRRSNLLRPSSGVPFALVAAVGWGLFFFLMIPATRAQGPWLSALLAETGVTLAAGMHVKLTGKELGVSDALRPAVIANAVLLCIGTMSFTVGVRYYDVAIVAALSNSDALVTTILGILLLKEHLHTREKVAAAVMIVGVGIIPLVSS